MEQKDSAEIEAVLNNILATFDKKQKELGINDVEMGKYLNMTSRNYRDILNGKVRLRFSEALLIMNKLGIDSFFIQKSEQNQNIEFLQALINKKDELLETAKMFGEISKTINLLFKPLDEDLNPENRIAQINIKATPEEKALIKGFAKEQNKSIVEILLETVKKGKDEEK